MRKKLEKVSSEITMHFFLCTNVRTNKHKSCGQSGSELLFSYLKDRMRTISERHGKVVKVNATGCLSNCSNGPVMVCYPQADWYRVRSTSDIDILISGLEKSWMQEKKLRAVDSSHELPTKPLYKPEIGIKYKDWNHYNVNTK